MIKQFLIVFLVFGFLACSNVQDKNLNNDNFVSTNLIVDTCEIIDSLANQPFLFKSWNVSLDNVLMFLPFSVILDSQVTASQYYDNVNDSITKIKIGQSVIEYVKTPSAGFIEQAVIVDSNIKFDRNIHIGDTYDNVCKKLNGVPRQEAKFRKIYINSGEATSTLIFEFSNNQLSKVIYWPYTG